MEESVKKSVGSERPHHYGSHTYRVTYCNMRPAAYEERSLHKLIFYSSVVEPKHLNDTAVRKAKEHGWPWTSFIIYDQSGQIVSMRVARKPKKT